MRTLEELKADLKIYWIENDKSFKKLLDKISGIPSYGGLTVEEFRILEGVLPSDKAENLIREWGSVDNTLFGTVGIFNTTCSWYESEEKPLPRMVMVRNLDGEDWKERELLAILPSDIECRYICRSISDESSAFDWRQMKEKGYRLYVPEYTMEELIDKIGHEFKIKKQ